MQIEKLHKRKIGNSKEICCTQDTQEKNWESTKEEKIMPHFMEFVYQCHSIEMISGTNRNERCNDCEFTKDSEFTNDFEFTNDCENLQMRHRLANSNQQCHFWLLFVPEIDAKFDVSPTSATHRQHTDMYVLQHTATHCNTLQHTATRCNTLQHTATHCNTLQHTVTRCNIPLDKTWISFCARIRFLRISSASFSSCVAKCCSVLQCIAVCCSVLQYVAACCH